MEEILQTYKIPLIGGISGLALAILMITVGFWRTLFLLILTVAGTYAAYMFSKSDFYKSIKQSFKKRKENAK